MREFAAVPSWVIDGWYGNNPDKQAHAIACYQLPVTTPAERELAQLSARLREDPNALIAVMVNAIPERRATINGLIEHMRIPTHPCAVCGQFAFPKEGTRCYWCGKGEWG